MSSPVSPYVAQPVRPLAEVVRTNLRVRQSMLDEAARLGAMKWVNEGLPSTLAIQVESRETGDLVLEVLETEGQDWLLEAGKTCLNPLYGEYLYTIVIEGSGQKVTIYDLDEIARAMETPQDRASRQAMEAER